MSLTEFKKFLKHALPRGIVRIVQKINTQRLKSEPHTLLKFEVHLADHCNLNCKGCDHFCPVAQENYANIKKYEKDMVRLSVLSGRKMKEILLLGGEPLLNSNITEFIKITRKYFDSGKIVVYTNGILLSKQPKGFWEICKNNNVRIDITNYPIKIDKDEIRRLADEYNIKIQYWGGDNKTLWKLPFDLNGNQNIYSNFKKCFKSNICSFLYEGKMYTCPTIPCIKQFNNAFNKSLKVTKEDYINIYEVKDISEIFEFLAKPVPFCRYCRIKSIKKNIPWGISKKEIGEWV
jgi:organic radical activating enzyme